MEKLTKHQADCLKKIKMKFQDNCWFYEMDCFLLFRRAHYVLQTLTKKGYLNKNILYGIWVYLYKD